MIKYNGKHFSALFTHEQIICQTTLTDRDAVLKELIHLLAVQCGIGNMEQALEAVLERENQIPSILGPGIAVPHARLKAIDNIVVGIVTSKDGFFYNGPDSEKIKLMILILAPKVEPGVYLQAISSLAKVCLDPSTAQVVSELPSAKKVWKFFDSGGIVLTDIVRARDIMQPVDIKLQENDTLEQAIDLFVRYHRRDLPVVDKDDKLIGVVTTYELLKVCLPDYILWMDDLTPILNFEPFAGILRKESQTWLTEIMTDEYATVPEDAPAIQVAKEITRQRAGHAYVINEEKLVGVVSIEGFLSKVLRE
jgi:mannitol/fructose-specific phosphotransferase system IIA component (Ntr-type)